MKIAFFLLVVHSSVAFAAPDPHVLIPSIAERISLEHSREIQSENFRHEHVVQALVRELFAVYSLDGRENPQQWNGQIDRYLEDRRRKIEDQSGPLSDIKNFLTKAKDLQAVPLRRAALESRKLCFSKSGNALLPCLNMEIEDSKSLIATNQFSMGLNRGKHCKYMNEWCEQSNEFSRKIIAREQARILDLQSRINIVKQTGDDPKKGAEIAALQLELNELQQRKNRNLEEAQEYLRRAIQKSRENNGQGLGELQNCNLSERNFCILEAEEALGKLQKMTGFQLFIIELAKSAAIELIAALEKSSADPSKPNSDDIRVGTNGLLELLYQGQWRGVCDDSFDQTDAEVACRQMGKQLVRYSTGRSGSVGFWLDDLGCNGNEASLFSCSHREIGSHDCGSGEYVAVECN